MPKSLTAPMSFADADDMNVPFDLFVHCVDGVFVVTADCFQPRRGTVWRDGFRDECATLAEVATLVSTHVLPRYAELSTRARLVAAAPVGLDAEE